MPLRRRSSCEVDDGHDGDAPAPVAAVPVEAENDPGRGPRPERATWAFTEGDELVPGRTVLQLLGGGSAYEVFLVWDDHRHALLVAKLLRPDRAADEAERSALSREAHALRSLTHPVLVRSFDEHLDGPCPHVVLEQVEGPTLRRLIRRSGPLPLEQTLPLALHVGAALQYLANAGWVHLDVKPDNVVMGVRPRLIDLSVARPAARAARITAHVGTDATMAPEQCDPGRQPIGPPADVFGLAATVWHAVAGTVPFPRAPRARTSPDLDERFPQLHADPVALPPRTPAPLEDALRAGLARDPADRPTAGELVEALEPLVATLPRRLVLARRGARPGY